MRGRRARRLPRGTGNARRRHLLLDPEIKRRISAHVFKAPHHGSHDFAMQLLDLVRPRISIISSGDDRIVHASLATREAMSEQGMYGERAELYDLIYRWKDYAAETARLGELLGSLGIAGGGRVLEAACGTGSHLVHLRDRYRVSGFDLSDAMLAVARTKLPPEVELFCADMADFAVPAPFDALLCLFSSIGYVHPEARLRAAAGCFARAVRPGGVLVIEPWLAPEAYRPGRLTMQTCDGEDLKLCRACISKQDGEMAVLDFHWLALREGASDVEHFVERHELWLCSTELMRKVFEEAGFDTRLEANGLTSERGLLIGRRRA